MKPPTPPSHPVSICVDTGDADADPACAGEAEVEPACTGKAEASLHACAGLLLLQSPGRENSKTRGNAHRAAVVRVLPFLRSSFPLGSCAQSSRGMERAVAKAKSRSVGVVAVNFTTEVAMDAPPRRKLPITLRSRTRAHARAYTHGARQRPPTPTPTPTPPTPFRSCPLRIVSRTVANTPAASRLPPDLSTTSSYYGPA
ncbi:hypothetical protein B0H16DRAFT_1572665 [Mycena metata]|uniref:Uncharacterized protein n=1 Tax=Mycena metata TaxID=1033252 RepID=A0AAD7MXQ4_9AGAR|nr:hypothetical protein B0H16DRAFT_1572665 [Mycena metata]